MPNQDAQGLFRRTGNLFRLTIASPTCVMQLAPHPCQSLVRVALRLTECLDLRATAPMQVQRLWEGSGWASCRSGRENPGHEALGWETVRLQGAAGKERDNGSACHGFKCMLVHFSSVWPSPTTLMATSPFSLSQAAHAFTDAKAAIHSLRGPWTDRQLGKLRPRLR